MTPLFSIIVPTHNHGDLLRSSVSSILEQTEQSFEVFIIGDGVTPETREVAQFLAEYDERVRFIDCEKGPRLGEQHRHPILSEQAKGKFVAYLCDDDLWLPNHLESLARNLENRDFVHAAPVVVMPGNQLFVYPGDLSIPECRSWLFENNNFIPLSSVGHTLEFYKKLPFGWRTSPANIPSGLYMFQQMLEFEPCRAFSTSDVTCLNFPSPLRMGWGLARREQELAEWTERMRGPRAMEELRIEVQRSLQVWLFTLDVKMKRQSLENERAIVDAQITQEHLSEELIEMQAANTDLVTETATLKGQIARISQELRDARKDSQYWKICAAEYRQVITNVEQSRWYRVRSWLKSMFPTSSGSHS